MVRGEGLGKATRGGVYRYISQLGEIFYQGMQESLTISTHFISIKTSMHNVLNDTNTSQSFPIYNSLNLSDLTKVFNSLPLENLKIFHTCEYRIFFL